MSLCKLSSALRSGVSVARLNGGRLLTRSMSGLDFKPVLDPPLDPLEESARSAFEKSCYLKINWKISENAMVIDAISRMVSHKIGALAVTEGDGDGGKVIGVLSERDFLCKVAFLGRDMRTTKASEVCTYGTENLVSVTLDNPIDACMKKMLARDIRHLLIRQKQTGSIVGMISIKDIVKCANAKHDAIVGRLTEMVVERDIMAQV